MDIDGKARRSRGAAAIAVVLFLALASLSPRLAVAQVQADGFASEAERAWTTRERAGALAEAASRAFDRFEARQRPVVEEKPARMRLAQSGSHRDIERGSDWLARVHRNYNSLIERLSEPTTPNPVVDATRRQQASRGAWLGSGDQADRVTVIPGRGEGAPVRRGEHEAVPGMPPVPNREWNGDGAVSSWAGGALDWLNRAYRQYQEEIVARLSSPSQHQPDRGASEVPVGEASPKTPGGTARTVAEQPPSGDAPKTEPPAERAPVAEPPQPKPVDGAADAGIRPEEARRAEMTRKAESERRAAERKAKEGAQQPKPPAVDTERRVAAERPEARDLAQEVARAGQARPAEAAGAGMAEEPSTGSTSGEPDRSEAPGPQEVSRPAPDAQRPPQTTAKATATGPRRTELLRIAVAKALEDAKRARQADAAAARDKERLVAELNAAGVGSQRPQTGAGHMPRQRPDRELDRPSGLGRAGENGRTDHAAVALHRQIRAKSLAAERARAAAQQAEKAAKRADTALRAAEQAADPLAQRRAQRRVESEARKAAAASRRAITAATGVGRRKTTRSTAARDAPKPIRRPALNRPAVRQDTRDRATNMCAGTGRRITAPGWHAVETGSSLWKISGRLDRRGKSDRRILE